MTRPLQANVPSARHAVGVVAGLFFGALCTIATSARAAVTLATPFGDHMVLQRQMPVPVWGTADADEQVVVEFAGQKKDATADKSGKWMVKLDPLVASADSRDLVVHGKSTLTLHDVLVGEVWLCSGQSNMEASLQRLLKSAAEPKLKAETVERVNRELATTTSGIRLLRMGTARGDLRRKKWLDCGPEALKVEDGIPGFSAVAYFFAREIHSELNVPVGAIESAVGGTRIESWTPASAYASVPAFKREAAETPLTIDGVTPGKNYRNLVEPLVPTAMRGVIWYQGETNLIDGDHGPRYADKMQALIESWRTAWGRPELPFYFVQLPRHLYTKRKPDRITNESLPDFREGQAMALRLPHTGMVVTTDLVDAPSDIHPPNKWDVGHRLALLALAQTYGRHDVVYSGPVFKSAEIQGDKVVISFDHVGGGLVCKGDKAAPEFLIAGADRKFVPAEGVIQGDKVIVSSSKVPLPAAVRFTWTELAVPTLFNREGLPAAPFRTDNWAAAEKP